MTALINTFRTAYARCQQYPNPPGIFGPLAGAAAVVVVLFRTFRIDNLETVMRIFGIRLIR